MRSKFSKSLSPWHRYFLKHLRWWLEKNWFDGDSYGWCMDVSILIAQIVGIDRFRLFSGRVLGLTAPTDSDGHVYGLLDDVFIVDLTLDGFRYPSGRKCPRIVALPKWSPFVQSTYRYIESHTRQLNDEVRQGSRYIAPSCWDSRALQAFQGLYGEWTRNCDLNAKPRTARTKSELQASRWALRGHRAIFDGKAKPVIRAFRKARSLDPGIELPTCWGPVIEEIVTTPDSRARKPK